MSKKKSPVRKYGVRVVALGEDIPGDLQEVDPVEVPVPSLESTAIKLTVTDVTNKARSEEANEESITTSTFTNTNPPLATTQSKEEDKGQPVKTDEIESKSVEVCHPTPPKKTEVCEGEEAAASSTEDGGKVVKATTTRDGDPQDDLAIKVNENVFKYTIIAI